MIGRAFEDAFRATTYRVLAADRSFNLRIGRKAVDFDAFLAALGMADWAIVTACNPGGRRSDGENERRHAALRTRVEALGLPTWPTIAIADAGDWPDEPGLLIVGASSAIARNLADAFGQLACVVGTAGSAPALLWTRTE